MKKKAYNKPMIQIVNINQSEIICTSSGTQKLRMGNVEEDDIPSHNPDDNDGWVIWGE